MIKKLRIAALLFVFFTLPIFFVLQIYLEASAKTLLFWETLVVALVLTCIFGVMANVVDCLAKNL